MNSPMKVYGVTGTNGKTTTAWVFAEFVSACPGRKCGYVTTVEAFDGARRFSTGYTTPPLARLHEILAAMEANGCTDCVMEVSSHAIHQNRTGDIVFAGGAFTNLSEDHLDYHKTMAEYFRVKASFAEKIAAQHLAPPDMGRRDLPPYVVCLDGENGREMFDAVGRFAVNVIPVTNGRGRTPPAPMPAYDLSGLRLVGDYNESNVLVAAALAEAAGVPHDVVQRVVPTLRPRWGRLERVENPRVKAAVYVDFAHTPDGLDKVLSAVRGFTKGRLWVVFGAGGDRDPMKRPLMGAACARIADCLVVTSDNPRGEEPTAIVDAILGGVREAARGLPRPPEVYVEPDRRVAIGRALANAGADDVVVVAGKGHETTQEVKGVKLPFDDREVVRSFAGEEGR